MNECYTQVVHTLVRSALSGACQSVSLTVISNSMAPLIRTGDHVRVEPGGAARPLRCGEVIVFQRGDNLIIHRLVGQHQQHCYTRGDSCLTMDPPVPQDAVLGRVVAVQRGSRRLDEQSRPWQWLHRAIGWACWCEWQLLRAEQRIGSWGRRQAIGSGGLVQPTMRWLKRCIRRGVLFSYRVRGVSRL